MLDSPMQGNSILVSEHVLVQEDAMAPREIGLWRCRKMRNEEKGRGSTTVTIPLL